MEDIATLGIKVDSSTVPQATDQLDRLTTTGKRAEGAADGMGRAFGGLKTALAGLGIAALVKEGIELADTYANIQGRLSLVTTSQAQLADVTDKLFNSAQRSRVSFEATADLYASLARSTKALGTSQGDLLQVTETINKALIVSGASAATAEGALTQLGQGFASGTLRGDELNAVLEGTPRLAQAIADGMHVTVGQLRALGAEGKITGETVFNALKSQKDAVEAEFAKMPTTVAQSFVGLKNEVLKFIGEANTASGTTNLIAESVALLARNLDIVVPVIGALGLALGVGYVASAIAATTATLGATTAMGGAAVAARAMGGALLGAFGGPIGLAVTGLTVGIAAFWAENQRAESVIKSVNVAHAELEKRLKADKEASDLAKTGTGNLHAVVSSSVPGFDSLTGSVRGLAGALYQQADAAKKARIELAATGLAQARSREAAALALTPAAYKGKRAEAGAALAQGDISGAASAIWGKVTGEARSLLSGGRTDREAQAAYRTAVSDSLQASKDLRAAYTTNNAALATGANVNAAAITKLKSGIADLQKLRNSANAEERKDIDKRIASSSRKITLLNTGANEDAVNSVVGTGGGGGSGSKGKTPEQTKYDGAVKQSETYIAKLKQEAEQVGLNDIQQRVYDASLEAAKAPTKALAAEITMAADAWATNTIAQRINESALKSSKEAAEKTAKANQDQLAAGQQLAEQMGFENSLLSMGVQQRTVALAARDLETKGIKEGTLAYDIYGKTILEAASAKGLLAQQADDSAGFADHMGAVNDNIRAATDSFGEFFGTAGEGFASLINLVGENAEAEARAAEKIAQARASGSGEAVRRAEADAAEDASKRELQSYGKIINGVKGMFNEKSKAYKVMEALEKTYATVRLALAVREIITEGLLTTAKVGGAGARIAADTVETASSVSKSGIRAAADGVAAFAKTLASLPFPLNLAAGAAVLAALVGVGVAISGGGGGGGSKGASASAESEDAKPTDYASRQSSYSVQDSVPGYGSGAASSSTPGRATNDNGGVMATNIGGNSFSYTIDARGSEDPDAVVSRVEGVMQNYQQETIDKARAAVQRDNIKAGNRQSIGGKR